jgi:hypothetical protein
MAEPEIQFPVEGKDAVIPDSQPVQVPAGRDQPPPVDAPAVPPSVVFSDAQTDEMEVYYCLYCCFMYVFAGLDDF